MVAPPAPRDDRPKTPPGPEGSNGIGRLGCRGKLAGLPPFSPTHWPKPEHPAGRRPWANGYVPNAEHGEPAAKKIPLPAPPARHADAFCRIAPCILSCNPRILDHTAAKGHRGRRISGFAPCR